MQRIPQSASETFPIQLIYNPVNLYTRLYRLLPTGRVKRLCGFEGQPAGRDFGCWGEQTQCYHITGRSLMSRSSALARLSQAERVETINPQIAFRLADAVVRTIH